MTLHLKLPAFFELKVFVELELLALKHDICQCHIMYSCKGTSIFHNALFYNMWSVELSFFSMSFLVVVPAKLAIESAVGK